MYELLLEAISKYGSLEAAENYVKGYAIGDLYASVKCIKAFMHNCNITADVALKKLDITGNDAERITKFLNLLFPDDKGPTIFYVRSMVRLMDKEHISAEEAMDKLCLADDEKRDVREYLGF